MKLVIKRTKKGSITGKSKYEMYVRADVTDEEATLIRENTLGPEQVVYHEKTRQATGFFSALMKMIKDTNMTVDTFVRGTTFTCKDVAELIEIEEDVRWAALLLRNLLEMARNFGGEEVINVDDEFERLIQEALARKRK